MKTSMSRFQIHDDLTAPEGSVPVLRGALATGGQLPNFLGVLAGSPAALRGYAKFRSELRHGKLTLPTLERIALAVAEYHHSQPGIAMHSRAARSAGLALDEVAAARQFTSKDPREASLLRYLQALLEEHGHAPMHLHDIWAVGHQAAALGKLRRPGDDRKPIRQCERGDLIASTKIQKVG